MALPSILSIVLPFFGGSLTGTLSWTTISATNMSANTFSDFGAALSNLNISNVAGASLVAHQFLVCSAFGDER
jgi:hypothetical protein